MIEATSLSAYREVLETLGERQKSVYQALKNLKEANNLMLSKYLNLPINCITGRVFELRNLKLVGVSEVKPCKVTGRKSIYWKCVKSGRFI